MSDKITVSFVIHSLVRLTRSEQAKQVNVVDWIIINEGIQVYPAVFLYWITVDPPSLLRVIERQRGH